MTYIEQFVQGTASAMNTKTAMQLKGKKLYQLQQATDYLYKMRTEYNRTNIVNFDILRDCPEHIQNIIYQISKESKHSKNESIVIDTTLRDAWGKSAEEIEEEYEEYEDDEDYILPAPTLRLSSTQPISPPKPKRKTKTSTFTWMVQNIPSTHVDRKQFPKPHASLNKQIKTQPIVVQPRKVEVEPTKTKMCFNILKNGTCTRGCGCTFAHSVKELSPIACRFRERCNRGNACTYFHPESETKEQYVRRIHPKL